jgi:hypothetical protein
MKRSLVYLLCICATGPLVPIYMLRFAALKLVAFLDWMTIGRGWAQPFVTFSEWVEYHLYTKSIYCRRFK